MADNKQRIANKIFKVLPMYEEDFGVYYKYLGLFSGVVDYFQYEEYERTKKSILDAFSDINALTIIILEVFFRF